MERYLCTILLLRNRRIVMYVYSANIERAEKAARAYVTTKYPHEYIVSNICSYKPAPFTLRKEYIELCTDEVKRPPKRRYTPVD